MGMRQKKCPRCGKWRPFDADRDQAKKEFPHGHPSTSHVVGKAARGLPTQSGRWVKIDGRWICLWCIKREAKS